MDEEGGGRGIFQKIVKRKTKILFSYRSVIRFWGRCAKIPMQEAVNVSINTQLLDREGYWRHGVWKLESTAEGN